MNLKGKIVEFLGDSITEGVGASETSKRYTDVFGEITGAVVKNHGISGTRIAKKRVPSQDISFDQDFISRVDELDENADIVVVFGGTNDCGHGDAPMGTPDSFDPYTFYGACNVLFTKLYEKYCGKTIVVMTPLHRSGAYSEYEKNEMGFVLYDYVKILREMTEKYSIPTLDLYKSSGIAPNVPKVMEELITDGLHPSDKGHRLLAERLKGFLESL